MEKNIDNSNLLKSNVNTDVNANTNVDINTNVDTNVNIKDKLHEINFSDNQRLFTILNEVIFYGAFVYYYYFGPVHDTNKTFIILKYILMIFVLRYLFNYITSYTIQIDKNHKKVTYFKLNSKIAIVSILILILNTQGIDNNITSLLLIISYAIISSCAKYGYTDDNIITVLVVYSLFTHLRI